MNIFKSPSLEKAFEDCLKQLKNGVSIENCLKAYPDLADELRPMLTMARQLQDIPAPAPDSAQIMRMGQKIFKKAAVEPVTKASRIIRWPEVLTRSLVWGAVSAAAAVIIAVRIALPDYFDMSDLDTDRPAVDIVIQPPGTLYNTEPAITFTPAVDTAIIIQSSETPVPEIIETEPTPDILNTPQSPDTQAPATKPAALSTESEKDGPVMVYVDLTGPVEEVEKTGDQVTLFVAGTQIQVSSAMLNNINIDRIQISGAVQEDGSIQAEQIVEAGNTPDTCERTPETTGTPCHPVLVILADAYQVSYAELLALKDEGTGIGEIARIYALADMADVDVETVLASRDSGASWQEILSDYPSISQEMLQNGKVIGDGQGYSLIGGNVHQPPEAASSGNRGNENGNPPTNSNSNNGANNPPGQNGTPGNSGNGNPPAQGNPPDNSGGNNNPPGLDSNPGNSGNGNDTPPGQDRNPGNSGNDNPPDNSGGNSNPPPQSNPPDNSGGNNNPPGQDNNPGNSGNGNGNPGNGGGK